jgi:hypothetical protein
MAQYPEVNDVTTLFFSILTAIFLTSLLSSLLYISKVWLFFKYHKISSQGKPFMESKLGYKQMKKLFRVAQIIQMIVMLVS